MGVGETLPERGENGERENDVAESVRADDEYSGRIWQQKRSPGCNGCCQNIPVIPLNCNERTMRPRSHAEVPDRCNSSAFGKFEVRVNALWAGSAAARDAVHVQADRTQRNR